MEKPLKRLTANELESYRARGYIAPVRAFSAEDAARFRGSLEQFERTIGTPLMEYPAKPTIFAKSHLLFTWIDAIVRHPAILDAVEDIVGPDIRVLHNNVFVKEPHSRTFVTWHQDGCYNGIMPPEVVTTWVALTDSNAETGCVRVLPGSHKAGLVVHVDRKSADNILSRGQQIADFDPGGDGVDMALAPGEMSIHHTFAVHCSQENKSAARRIGVMTTYMPAHCRYAGAGRACMRAALVRGNDAYGHFEDEPRPEIDFGAAERAAHRDSCERYIANITSTENTQLAHARPAAALRANT